MEDKNTADSLQIEIAASSASAEKRIDELTAALERLKSASTGFGNVSDRIKEIGRSAESAASTKAAQKKEEMDRSVAGAGKSSGRLDAIDSKIEKAKANITELNEQIRMLGFAHDKEQAAQVIDKVNNQLLEQQAILEGLIQKREKASAALSREGEKSFNLEAFKEKIKGSTLGNIVGDTKSISDAVSKLIDMGDQISIMQIKADGLREKLAAAFERGNLNQIASYTEKIQKLQSDISALQSEAGKTKVDPLESFKESVKGTSVYDKIKDAGSIDEAIGKLTELGDEAGILELKLSGVQEKLRLAFGSGNLSQIATYISQIQSLREQINSIKFPEEPIDRFEEIKEEFAGTTLGGIIGDASSMDEAVERIRGITDQVTILNIKLDSLGVKLRSALEKGDSSQIANYAGQIQKLQEQIDKLREKDSDKDTIESEGSLEKKKSILERIAELVGEINGKKIEIKDERGKLKPEGLKDLLKADISLQNIIPKGASAAFDSLKNSVGGLTDKMMSFAAAHPAAAGALVALKSAAQTAWNGFKGLARFSFSALMKGFDLVSGAAKKLASTLGNLAKAGINKAVSGLKSLASAVGSRFTRPFKKAAAVVTKWKNAIGRVIFYRTVRGAIKAVTDGFKTGVENLYQYSKIIGTDFAPAMDKLATSALYLKNSLGAMAAPLIEALAPAIDYLVDKFVSLLNVIGKTFAALTGKDVYSQARKHAVEYAESAEEAKKETEKFKKFLLGIDELNIIPGQDEDDAGKKNPLEDYASMFEEVQVPVEQLDWAKQIREAIENGDWYSVGKIVAEKLNEIVDGWDAYGWGRKLGGLITNGLNVAFGFLENFDFENLGKKLADWLNGIFDGIDWDLLGRTLAEKWNALFDFIYGFATSLNWTGIGLDIAKAINGFIDQFDPEKAAAAINEFVLGIFRLINTAITETHWDELGTKLAQFINEIDWAGIVYNGMMAVVNGVKAIKELVDDFLAKWDWKTMADEIASGINAALSDVDWDGLGRTMSDMIYSFFGFAFELLSKIDWMQIASGLVESLTGFIDEIGTKLNIKGITDPIVEMVNTVFDGIQTIVEKTKEWLGTLNLEPAKESFENLMGAVSPLVETITNGLAWAWENILLPLGKWFIEERAPAGIDLLTTAISSLNKILNELAPIFEALWNGILKPFASFLGGAFVAAIRAVSSAIEAVTSVVSGFIQLISDAINSIQNFLGTSKSASSSVSSLGGKRNSSTFSVRQTDVFSEIRNIPAPKAYASGGFPSRGEMFIARDAGPELVGKIGQKTAVANNDQITSGIADGVRDANTDVVNAVYAMANMIVKAVEEKDTDINLDGQSLARGIQPYQNRLSSLQGASLVD